MLNKMIDSCVMCGNYILIIMVYTILVSCAQDYNTCENILLRNKTN